MAKNKARFCELKTPFENDNSLTWNEYPRPQFKRESYISLCGEWELSVIKNNNEENLGEIIVPFVPESRISKINRSLSKNEKYIYFYLKKYYDILDKQFYDR